MTEIALTHNRRGLKALRNTVIAAALLVFAGTGLAQDEDPTVLEVDGRTETVSGFEGRFDVAVRGLLTSMGMPVTPDMLGQLQDLRPEYLDQLASDFVLLNEAERRGIELSEDSIDAAVSGALAGIPEEELGDVFTQAGFRDMDHFRELVSETEIVQLLLEELHGEMDISDDEIDAWWAENSAEFAAEEQVCAAHILVEDEDLADELYAELEGGADFAELAREHSTDPGSGENGGDLGCFGRGMMVEEFEEAAFSAEPGEVTGPVESDFGHHLVLVHEHQDASEPDLEENREEVEVAIGNERLGDVIDELVAEADITTHEEHLPAPDPAFEGEGDGALDGEFLEVEPVEEEAPAEEDAD